MIKGLHKKDTLVDIPVGNLVTLANVEEQNEQCCLYACELLRRENPTGVRRIMALFQDLNSKGKTIVFVTHEPDIARCMTRSVVFRDGLILKEEAVGDRLDARALLEKLPVENEQ